MRVCIIGEGLSSLTLAIALVNEKIFVDLLVEKKPLLLDKSRTIGISRNNIEYFNNRLINIKKLIWKLNKIQIFTENFRKEKLLNFETSDDQLFSVVKNYQLYNILKKKLSKSKYFKKKKLKITLNKLDHYDLVINNDYSNFITKKYFNKKLVKKYNSTAYTTIINHKKIENKTAIQIFTKNGPLAFLPISNKETSVVYSIHNTSQINQNIIELIKSYNLTYNILKIQKVKKFELNSLNLRSYYHNNILAFGDLLHRVHPLAGQGFNMTIRDIKILINIIINKKNLGLPLDKSVNYEFEKISKHKNLIFSSGIDIVHEIFNIERKTKNELFGKSVQFIGRNRSINKFFRKVADKGIFF